MREKKSVKQKVSYFVKAVKAVCVRPDLSTTAQFPTRREETERRDKPRAAITSALREVAKHVNQRH